MKPSQRIVFKFYAFMLTFYAAFEANKRVFRALILSSINSRTKPFFGASKLEAIKRNWGQKLGISLCYEFPLLEGYDE